MFNIAKSGICNIGQNCLAKNEHVQRFAERRGLLGVPAPDCAAAMARLKHNKRKGDAGAGVGAVRCATSAVHVHAAATVGGLQMQRAFASKLT